MERHDHAGGNGQTLNLRVIGGDYHYTAAGQLAQHEDTSTVQLSGDLFSGRWGTDGEWMLGAVGGYSDNQGDSRSNMTGTRADNQNHGYAVGLTSSWFQHGDQKQGAWLDSWLQYAWFNNDVSEHEDGADHYHSSGIIASLEAGYQWLTQKYPRFLNTNNYKHLGTLGTGNHFIEICLDESDQVWIMLHSGSRGIGNAIGTYFIDLAQKEMQETLETLPSRDLAYFMEGTEYFDDYLKAVAWAQLFASLNRDAMMENVVTALQSVTQKTVRQPQTLAMEEINCHHNYVQKEQHFGEEIYVTRKGAVSARAGQYGIIPGSMGAKSFIVRGLGNEESFCSCSHGAGRVMSRTKAKKLFSVEDQIRATAHVECRKDAEVIDEIPMAYKDIDAVMAAQSDLVEVIYTLRQVVCVKG